MNRIKNFGCSIVLQLTTSSSFLFAQTEIRIAPSFGFQAIQSYVKDDMYADDRFRSYNFYTSPMYGLGLQFDIKDGWLISTSLNSSRAAISFKYGESGRNTFGANRHVTNLSLGVQRKISTHKWFKINPQKIPGSISSFKSREANSLYWLLFKLKLISGVSHDWVANFPGTKVFRNTSSSLFFGFGIHFFDQSVDKLQLNFIYNLGLNEIAEWETDYIYISKNSYSQKYSGIVATKGSIIAMQIAYPFRLLTIKKREKIN